MKQRFTLLSCLLLFTIFTAFAQNRNVKGKVTDENDQPLIGVTVKVNTTHIAAATDARGNFSIAAKPTDTLIFSFIGYDALKIPVTSAGVYNAKLHISNIALNEAVVIGYQSITRRSVTTAVSSVTSKDIAPTTTSNVGETLQGKVPGLEVIDGGGTPGASPKLLVRGFATITGASNPLIVVDGVVTAYGSLNDINPADIARVDVLKDAAATAIYGSRGGEGVIIITTKRGANGKTQINFNGTSGMNHLENPNLAATPEYLGFYTKVYAANNETLPPNGAASGINTNWWNQTIKNSYTHNYNLSLSSEKNGLSFYGSVGYFDQTSNFDAQRGTGDYEKVTTRFNIDYKISKVFKMGVNLAPRFEKYGDGGGTNLTDIMLIAPNVAVTKSAAQTAADVNAYAASNPNSWDFTAYNPVYSQFTRSDFSSFDNPVAQMARDFNGTKYFGTQGSAYLEVSPIKGLTFKTSFSGFYNTSNQTNYVPKYYIDPLDYNDKSQVSQNTVEDYRWQIDNTLNYVGNFNNHHINILLGQSADNYVYQNSYVYRQDIPYDSEPYRYVSAGATLVDASGSYQPGAGPFGKMSSYFSRVQYDFKETYYISGSFRADGSSLLSPQNRWGYFPTISGADVIS
ncbi:MAG: SusC/RagA family TonB-linked outer membrane protein, partial [Mucilaginibacter sp.]